MKKRKIIFSEIEKSKVEANKTGIIIFITAIAMAITGKRFK